MKRTKVNVPQDHSWIGVDLDGTLARYDQWMGWNVFGEPIPTMVERVRRWLAEGKQVRIMTARVGVDPTARMTCRVTGEQFTNMRMAEEIQRWCKKHVGQRLTVTCVKDMHMVELWDDRVVQVIPNTGRTLAEEHEAEKTALRGKP